MLELVLLAFLDKLGLSSVCDLTQLGVRSRCPQLSLAPSNSHFPLAKKNSRLCWVWISAFPHSLCAYQGHLEACAVVKRQVFTTK